MTDTKPQPIDYSDGPIHAFFGLSYAAYQVVPRVLAQSMPGEWQARFVQCMDELETAFAHLGPVDYDVQTAESVYVDELTEDQMKTVGVSCIEDSPEGSDGYYDRYGNKIEGQSRVMVPVPDPLPSYNRGRTRVPRADQLAAVHSCNNCDGADAGSCLFNTGAANEPCAADQVAEPIGGWILWDSEGRWMHVTTWTTDADRPDDVDRRNDGWRSVSINEAEGREFRSKGCILDRLDPAGWRAFDQMRGTTNAAGSRDRWLAEKAGA